MGKQKKEEVADEMEELLQKFQENTIKLEEVNYGDNTENIDDDEEENINEEPKHFEIIEKIKKIEKYFNEVDEYFENISSYQSQNDEYLSDLLHYAEKHEFTQASALKFVNLLKEKRIRRRTLNNDWEIKRVFDTGRNRFSMYNQRDMFMASLYKKEKELSCPYNPRQISFEEIDELISVKRGRKSKEKEGNQELVEV